jgi:hypothetical protein
MKAYQKIAIAVFLLSSCTGTKISSKSDRVERAVIEKTQKQTQIDSIHVYKHDSIYIKEKNDTVFIEKWHTRIAYRDRLRTDTLHVTDTFRISNIVEKTVEVEVNKITGWQKAQIWAGRIFMAIWILTIGWLILRIWR